MVPPLPHRDKRDQGEKGIWSSSMHRRKKELKAQAELIAVRHANDVLCAAVNKMSPTVSMEVLRCLVASLIRRHT